MDYEKKLEVLLRLGRMISRENDIDRLLETISDFAIEIVGAERCSIFIHDADRREVWTKVAHGVEEVRVPDDEGLVGATIQSREIQICLDPYHDARFFKGVDEETGFVTRSLLTVPLFDKRDGVLGVIEMINKRDGLFSSLDAELLVLLANYISTTLENAFLQQKVRTAQTGLIHRLSTAAEFKDEETSAHTKRVAYYAALIAEALGQSREDVDELVLTAPMHDVGKIGIPDAVIHKPGKLTNEEFDVIKTHTTIGYNILYDPENALLRKAAVIARDHHEKWNGKGYPNGRAGEEISVDGRIVAVVDVFDALTSRRPYKEPWSIERAFELLAGERNQHFDGEMVEIFLSREEQVREIHHKYKEEE